MSQRVPPCPKSKWWGEEKEMFEEMVLESDWWKKQEGLFEELAEDCGDSEIDEGEGEKEDGEKGEEGGEKEKGESRKRRRNDIKSNKLRIVVFNCNYKK